MSESDKNLVEFGWADGYYQQKCITCDSTHVAAKRSFRCKKCAQQCLGLSQPLNQIDMFKTE